MTGAWWYHLGMVLLPLLCCACAAIAGEPPAIEPSDEETVLLELANRFRADPAAEGVRLTPSGAGTDTLVRGIDVAAFRRETAALPKAQPLVFTVALIVAARNHARYVLHHGVGNDGHAEDPAQPGFTGERPHQRVTAAGFPLLSVSGENLYQQVVGMADAHAGFVIDPDFTGQGPGGMQAHRGHRANLANPDVREAGFAVLRLPANRQTPAGSLLVVQEFAARQHSPRYLGGVVYIDANRNRAYDPGEGVGGVVIAANDGATTTTWSSGAYTLALAGSVAVQVTCTRGPLTVAFAIAAGEANAKQDWIIPQDEDRALALRLIAAVERAAPGTPARRVAEAELAVAGLQLAVDDGTRARVEALAAATAARIAADQAAVRAVLDDDAALAPVLARATAAWSGTAAAAWFTDVPVYRGAQAVFEAFAKAANAGPIPAAWPRQTRTKLAWSLKHAVSAEFRGRIAHLLDALGEYGER